MRKEILLNQPEPTRKQTYHPNFRRAVKYAKQFHERNQVVESGYHFVVAEIKKLYATLHNKADRTYFEMDRKHLCNSVEGMNDFVTPHIYLVLECDVWDMYWVYFALQDCPFKEAVDELFKRFTLTNYLKGKVFKEPLKEYFEAVLAYQSKRFIKTANPDDYQFLKNV